MGLLTQGAYLLSGPCTVALPQDAQAGSFPDDSRKNSEKNFSHKTRSPAVRTLSTPNCRHISLSVEDSVDALVDILSTQAFAEDQISDLVSTHTPATSAATAVPTFRGTEI